jgi:hypothetical protein
MSTQIKIFLNQILKKYIYLLAYSLRLIFIHQTIINKFSKTN